MKQCKVCQRHLSYERYYKLSPNKYFSHCKDCYIKGVIKRRLINKGWNPQKIDLYIANRVPQSKVLKTIDIDPDGTKACSKCKIEQPVKNFYTTRNVTSSNCKACKSKYNKNVRNVRRRERFKTDPNYKLGHVLRKRFYHIIKNQSYSKSSIAKLLGCTLPEARIHIERQFKRGMTWNNHGMWHIDHIIPISKFDLTIKNQQQQCWHYTNLQPLWAKDNIAKHNKIKDAQLKILL